MSANHSNPVAPDVLNRNWKVATPNVARVTDMAYVSAKDEALPVRIS